MTRTRNVQTARRMEVFSRAVRPVRKLMTVVGRSGKESCGVVELPSVDAGCEAMEKKCSRLLLAWAMAALYPEGKRVERLRKPGDATVGIWSSARRMEV